MAFFLKSESQGHQRKGKITDTETERTETEEGIGGCCSGRNCQKHSRGRKEKNDPRKGKKLHSNRKRYFGKC